MNCIARLFVGSLALVCFFLSSVSQAANPQATCPSGVNSAAGSEPVLRIKGNPALMVCGSLGAPEDSEAASQWKGKVFLEGFEVYSIKPKAKPQKLLQYSELDRALISKKAQELVIEKMIYSQGSWTPAFESHFSRSGSEWKQSKEEVIFKSPKALSKEKAAEVRALLVKSKAQESLDEMDVAKIFDSALSGNAESKAYFESPTLKKGLDGASAEEYQTDHRILKRLSSGSETKK